MLYYAILCYASLCCVVLCCAMLCYAVLCYVMLFYVMLWYAMLCYVVLCLCCAMLCYGMLCYVVLCCAMLCCAMLCYAMLCYVMLCYAMPCCGCFMLSYVSYLIYLVNKPPQAVFISIDNVRGSKIVRKMNCLPGKCETLRATLKPKHYPSIYQQAGKGVYLFIYLVFFCNPVINFRRRARFYCVADKTASDGHGMIAAK